MKNRDFRYSALFLDRDGVINKRIVNAYVTMPSEFVFLPGVLEAIKLCSEHFRFIFIVTNQQGVGRGLMTEEQLNNVHLYMLKEINKHGGRIDKVFFCPHRADDNCTCRKPKTGMFVQAKEKFSLIDEKTSVMVGDTLSDMMFGKNCGLKNVLISEDIQTDLETLKLADFQFSSLFQFAKHFV